MLWYKMWRESWIRFAISAAALLWMCGAVVLLQQQVRAYADAPLSYVHYVWHAVYKANALDLYILLVIVLGLGGVQQERAHGTAGFTLSLPVSRWRLIAARAGVGWMEVAVLALLPALLIPLLSPFVGQAFPFVRALQFSVLWAGCGVAIFALTFFFSAVLSGAYSPAIASVAAVVAGSVMAGLPLFERFQAFDLIDTMHGAQLLVAPGDASPATFVAPLPWLSLDLYVLLALCLTVVAGGITARRDFS